MKATKGAIKEIREGYFRISVESLTNPSEFGLVHFFPGTPAEARQELADMTSQLLSIMERGGVEIG